MLKVQQYGNRWEQTNAIDIPKASRSVPEPVDTLGGLVDSVSKVGLQISKLEEDRASLEAESALQDYIRQSNDMLYTGENPYYNTKARDAVDGMDPTIKNLEGLKRDALKRVKNPRAQAMLAKSIESRYTQDRAGIQKHSMTGQAQWNMDLAKVGVEQASEYMRHNINSHDKVLASAATLRTQIKAANPGADSDVINEKVQNAISKTLIAGMGDEIDRGNTGNAKALLKKYKNHLEVADLATIEAKLKDKGDKEFAQAYVDKIMTSNMGLDAALAKARDELTGDREDDAVARIKSRYNEMEAAEKLNDQKLIDAAWDIANSPTMSTEDKLNAINNPMRSALGSSYKSMRDWLVKGEDVATDWQEYYKFSNAYINAINGNKEAREFLTPTNLYNHYRTKMSDTEFKKAMRMVEGLQTANGSDPTFNSFQGNSTALNELLTGWFGSKADWDDNEQYIAGQMLMDLTNRADAWSRSNNNQKLPDAVRNEWMLELKQEYDWAENWWPVDTTGNVGAAHHKDILAKAVEKLRDSGKPLTSRNVHAMYQLMVDD